MGLDGQGADTIASPSGGARTLTQGTRAKGVSSWSWSESFREGRIMVRPLGEQKNVALAVRVTQLALLCCRKEVKA